jgi:hypothetical protein
MPRPPRPWTVTRHDPIQQIDDNLWTVDGAVPGIPGGGFPRKMSIVKLSEGALLLHNAIPLSEPEMKRLADLGRPAYLVAPSPFHCLDANAMRERLGVKVICPAAAASQIRERVPVDGGFDALPADPALRAEPLDGTTFGEGVLVLKSGPGGARTSLLFCDAMLNIPNLPGFWGWLWKVLGFTGKALCGPVWLKRAVSDRAALRAHLERLSRTEGLARLVPSHGENVEVDPGGTLRAVAATIKA